MLTHFEARKLSMCALFGVLLMISDGCTRQIRPSTDTAANTETHCLASSTSHLRQNHRESVQPREEIVARLPARTVNTAKAIGIVPFLNKIPQLEADLQRKREGAELFLLENNQQIQTMIMLALAEAGHTAGIVRCEQARTSDVANRLDSGQQSWASRNTLTAVIISGLTDMLLGALTVVDAGVTIGIVGGIGGAAQLPFIGMALYGQDVYEFRHERNLLKGISDQSHGATLFPTSVWAFLNEPRPEGTSLRTHLSSKWGEQDGTDEEHQKEIALLLGDGGLYNVATLRKRAALLEELAASIDLMHEDLELLIQDVLVSKQSHAVTYQNPPSHQAHDGYL